MPAIAAATITGFYRHDVAEEIVAILVFELVLFFVGPMK